MRVLLITSDYPPRHGGIGVVAYNLMTDLTKSGNIVKLLNFDGSSESNYKKMRPRDFFYTRATRNNYHRLTNIINPMRVFRPGGFREFVYNNMVFRVSRQLVNDYKPDLVHILKADLYTAVFDTTVPFVVSCHSEEIKETIPILYSLKHATKIHCVSEYAKKTVIALSPFSESKIQVIHNTINIRAQNIGNTSKERNSIVSIGRLVKAKNFCSIIEAYSMLNPLLRSKHELIIIGTGPEEKNLRLLISKLKLDGQVKLLGRVSEDEKTKRLNQSKLFILCPTRHNNEEEGFGIVFLEAQSQGVPVIGSRTGGAPEAIGKGGILVNDELSPFNIMTEMDRLLLDEKLYNQLKDLAFENVNKFDRSNWVPQFLNMYKTIINHR